LKTFADDSSGRQVVAIIVGTLIVICLIYKCCRWCCRVSFAPETSIATNQQELAGDIVITGANLDHGLDFVAREEAYYSTRYLPSESVLPGHINWDPPPAYSSLCPTGLPSEPDRNSDPSSLFANMSRHPNGYER
jgi:hypothetical protein